MASHPVYLEIVNFFASGTTPQMVVDFEPSAAAQGVRDFVEARAGGRRD